jgi:hypothetical protein
VVIASDAVVKTDSAHPEKRIHVVIWCPWKKLKVIGIAPSREYIQENCNSDSLSWVTNDLLSSGRVATLWTRGWT